MKDVFPLWANAQLDLPQRKDIDVLKSSMSMPLELNVSQVQILEAALNDIPMVDVMYEKRGRYHAVKGLEQYLPAGWLDHFEGRDNDVLDSF